MLKKNICFRRLAQLVRAISLQELGEQFKSVNVYIIDLFKISVLG